MATVSIAAIVVMCITACIVPIILFYIGGVFGCKLCGNKGGYFAYDNGMRDYIVTCCIPPSCCIGLICFLIYLILILTSDDKSQIFAYFCVLFIVPLGTLLICWSVYWLHGFTDIAKQNITYNKQCEIDFKISNELKDESRRMRYYFGIDSVLFMGNNINTTTNIFDNIYIYCNERGYTHPQKKNICEYVYHNELLMKYIIKNLKSIIILTNKNKDHYNKILGISTVGSIANNIKDIKELNKKILNVWNDKDIQNIVPNKVNEFKSDDEKYLIDINEQMCTIDTNDFNIINAQFMNHFLTNKRIKKLSKEQSITNNEDINILLNEHQFYENIRYFGRNECEIECKDRKYNLRMYESQQIGCKCRKYEKWLDIFVEWGYDIECVVYIVDLSLFKNGNKEYEHLIKYWYNKYIPFDVQMLIMKYVTNECFIDDIHRFQRLAANCYDEGVMVVLFVNCDIFFEYINNNGIDQLKQYFPNTGFEHTIDSDKNKMNENILKAIKDLYSKDGKCDTLLMNDVNDIKRLKEIWEEICIILINHSLRDYTFQ